MGCCISTNTEAQASSVSKKDQLLNVGSDEVSKLKGFSHENRAPPPSSAEEETVKEVLSETPKPKLREADEEEEGIKNAHKLEVFAKTQENLRYENKLDKKQHQLSGNEEIMSEVSEICSLSVSESVSTMTNITDARDNEEEQEVKQQRVTRSPGKLQPRNGVKRDRVVNQSPTWRSDQSPARRINNRSLRSVQCSREEADQTMGRRGSMTNPGRKDPGESSGRRSRSPATTRSISSSAAMARSPSAGRANRSPARVKSDPIESSHCSNNNRRVDGSNTESTGPSNNNDANDNCSTNESLENPLVSLECFIFL